MFISGVAALSLSKTNTWNHKEKGTIVGVVCGTTLAITNFNVLNQYKYNSN